MEKKFMINFSRKQKVSIFIIFTIIVLFIIGVLNYKDNKTNSIAANSEMARTLTYAEAQDGDEDIKNTENVKFDAFFLQDLDGDGNAEKIRGTCKEVGKEDTLYMELKVQTEGYLENARIEINGKNFYLQTSLPKDSELKYNYIGNNIKELEFNTINSGSQKVITGIVRSGDYNYDSRIADAIGNNINKYSKVNDVKLTGTYVGQDGARTYIEKNVEFNVDWYGTIDTNIYSTSQNRNITEMINKEEGTISFNFDIYTEDREEKLLLKSNHIEGEIPEINGYLPIEVKYLGKNDRFNYDETTRKFTIDRETEIIHDEVLKTTMDSRNKYEMKIVYSIEAYESVGKESIQLQIPVKTYYKGYNNPNIEFNNPYISNIESSTIVLDCNVPPTVTDQTYRTNFNVKVGRYIWNDMSYLVLKDKPLNLYNGNSEEENDDTYKVMWKVFIGTEEKLDSIIMKETANGEEKQSDKFIKKDSTIESMEDVTSNVGIYFYGADTILGDDGWIKIYDDETDTLLETFTKDTWNKYKEENPYRYELPVKHIRIETSKAIKNESYLTVYNIKELDDEKIIQKYEKNEFDGLQHISSRLVGYVGNTEIEKVSHTAKYVAPESEATVFISRDKLSTQESEKNIDIYIQTIADDNKNEVRWKNGSFLLRLPEELIDVKLNEISINNTNVSLESYELVKENGQYFIKILTENETPQTYTIRINLDLTANPRMSTATRNIELYATNEKNSDYYYKTSDIYDVNNNLNTEEQVYYNIVSISMISPNSLLTTQIASNYDENGSIALAPQIIELEYRYDLENEKTVDIGIDVINNYSNTISEVSIIGKIPFEGNTFVLSKNNLNSEFSTRMTEDGLRIPEAMKDEIKVYYSENENPDKDLSKAENGWKTKDEVKNWDTIKSFFIDFQNYIMDIGEKVEFGYTIKIPKKTELNKTSYSHHGIEFCLDTEQGKYRTSIEPNKLGIRLTKKYNFELQKYQENKEKLISKVKYSIKEISIDKDGNEKQEVIKTDVTNSEGKIQLSNLAVEKIYEVKEIKAPEDYELNSDAIRFICHMNEDGSITIEKLNGETREEIAIEKDEVNNYKVVLKLEDKVKARLKITKKELGTENRVEKAYYKVTGEGLPQGGKILSTNKDGELTFVGLSIGEEYVLQEVKVSGYYLSSPVTFKILKQDESYEVEILDGEVLKESFSEEDNIPVLNIVLEDEKIPTYNLEVTKIKRIEETTLSKTVEENSSTEETTYLEGAKFKLYKGKQEIGEYVTDSTGKITITGLYLYEEGRNINQTYTLKEVSAPQGYTKVKDITFRVQNNNGSLQYIEELSSGQTEKAYTVEENTVKLIIEDTPAFKLVKKDFETKMPVANVKFAIYNVDVEEVPAKNNKNEILGTKEIVNGKEYYTLTTNENGEIIAELPEGIYKAVEIEAPEKYDVTDTIQYFGIGTSIEGNKSLEKIWSKEILTNSGDQIVSAKETSDGGIIIAGNFRSNIIDLGNDVILTKKVATYYTAGMVIKYSQDKEVEWAKAIESDSNVYINSVNETTEGNILVGGSFNGRGMIAEYSSKGEEIWGNLTIGIDISFIQGTADKGIVIAGELKDYCKDFGIEPIGKNNGFIAKYDNSKELQWAKVVGGSKSDYINSLSETSDGGILVGGYFTSSEIELEENVVLENTSSCNGMIIKYNTLGSVDWTKTIGGSDTRIKSVQETNDNGYIVAGYFRSQTLDLGNGTILEKGSGYNTEMVIKYDMALNVEWAKTEGEGINIFIEEADDNGFVLYNGSIIKYNSIGEIEWKKEIKSNVNSLLELTSSECLIIEDKAISKYSFCDIPEVKVERRENADISIESMINNGISGYIAGGYFEDTIDLGNGIILESNGGLDAAIIKYSSMGNVEWARTIGGEEVEQINYITSTSDNGVIAVGYFTSLSIDLGNNIFLDLTDDDLTRMVIKFNSNGETEWAKAIGNSWSDKIDSVLETKDGGILVSGQFYADQIDLEDGIVLERKNEEAGMIIKYDAKGKLEWANTVEISSRNGIDTIIETKDGGYAITGNFSHGTYDLGNGVVLNCAGARAGMLIKCDSNGNIQWAKAIGGEKENELLSIVETSDGGYIVSGYLGTGKIDFGNGIVLNGSNNYYSGMLIKFSNLGEVEWAKNSEEVNSILQDSDGGIVVSTFSGLFKYSTEGKLEWSNDFETTSAIRIFDGTYLVSNYGEVLRVRAGIGISETQELIVENKRKEFAISTGVKKIGETKGGDISGENLKVYERVKYGDNSKKEIIMTPDKGYEIIAITVNGEKHVFTQNEDGTYTMPVIQNITEDQYIEVSYGIKYEDIIDDKNNNIIVINKIDSKTKEPIPEVTFKIEEVKKREGLENAIGNPVGNGRGVQGVDYKNPENIEETMVQNGDYYFIENNGTYIPNNSDTQGTVANSYIPIDLRNKDKEYAVVVNGEMECDGNALLYASISGDTNAPGWGNIMDVRYSAAAQNYYIYLPPGNLYYLHLGYENSTNNLSNVKINSIQVCPVKEIAYEFIEKDGKYEPNNKGIDDTCANSYIPIDLSGCTGKYNLTINAQVSSDLDGDIGYMSITESPYRIDYRNAEICLSGNVEAKDYNFELSGGKIYYLQLGYYKNSYYSWGDDSLIINSLNLTPIDSSEYSIEVQTNSEGKAIVQIPFGTYNIKEIAAPEKYLLADEIMTIDFALDGQKEFTIENTVASEVIAHHYKANRNAEGNYEYTEEKIVEDNITRGKVGEKYITAPKLDLEKYELIKDENGNYDIPKNATGTYGEDTIEVNYYYAEKEIPLTVYHYIEGTNIKVPLMDGTEAEEEVIYGKEGEEYVTNGLANDRLSNEYELVEEAENKSGVYKVTEVFVTYYYKKIERNITIVKYAEDGQTPLQGTKFKIKPKNQEEATEETYVTDVQGKIRITLEAGEYELIEVEPSEGYMLPENPITNINVTRETEDETKITLTNERARGQVIVHYYLEGTTEKIIEDEIKTGVIGEIFATKPSDTVPEYCEYVKSSEVTSGKYAEETQEVIYYYRLKDYEYKIEYYYNNIKDEEKTETRIATYGTSIEEFSNKMKYGYKYEKAENFPLKVSEVLENNIIKIHYIPDEANTKDLFYTVEFYKDNEKIDKDTQIEKQEVQVLEADILKVNKENINITDKYNGYKLDKIEYKEETSVELPNEVDNESVIKVYYVLKDAKLTVKYVDKFTNEEISDKIEKTGKFFEKYDISEDEKEIEGYTIIERPEELTGILGEEEEKIFYYAKNTNVIVKYLEKDETPENNMDNKILAEEIIINGYEGKEYKTEQKEIENYTFVESTENTSGIMIKDRVEVIYYYLQNTKVIVNYIDKTTGEKLETIEKDGVAGDTFIGVAKDFENYVLIERPENETVTMEKEEIVLNYYYVHISKGLVEKHIDITTNEILDSVEYEGNVGDEYETSPKEFEGYDLVKDKLPENAKGILTLDGIEVKYYYVRNLSVKVEYIDKITDEKILEANGKDSTIIIEGHEGDTYKTEEKQFNDYVIVAEMYPENTEGTMKTVINSNGTIDTEIIVRYYYVHVSAGVIERHIDVKTGKLIEKETLYNGNEGDKYKTQSKEFEDYDIVEDNLPNNAEGIMIKEEIIVNYYYERKMKVVVEYIEKMTEIVMDTETIFGHEGDIYETKEKEYKGYKLTEVTSNTYGEMKLSEAEDGTIYVKYYYARESAGVKEEHIDIRTGKVLDESVYNGYEGDEYETFSKQIKGYKVMESKYPENAKGQMTKEEIIVKYYYTKQAKVIVQYIDNETKSKIVEDITIDGYEGKRYETEVKVFDGYKLFSKPENAEGKMQVIETDDGELETITYVRYYYTKVAEENKVSEKQEHITNIYNNISNNNPNPSGNSTNVNGKEDLPNKQEVKSDNNVSERTPGTGDMLPIVTLGTIVLVIVLNILYSTVKVFKGSKKKFIK